MKRIISCLLMLCLVLSLTGCSSVKDEDWQEAYEEWRVNNGISAGPMLLADLNSDNVPELIFIKQKTYNDSFTSSDGREFDNRNGREYTEDDLYIVSYNKSNLIEYHKYLGVERSDYIHLLCYNDNKKVALSYSQYTPIYDELNNNYDGIETMQIINIDKKNFEDGSVYTRGRNSKESGNFFYTIDGANVEKDDWNKDVKVLCDIKCGAQIDTMHPKTLDVVINAYENGADVFNITGYDLGDLE